MRRIARLLFLALTLSASVFFVRPVAAQTVLDLSDWFEITEEGVDLHFYFFWSASCPHCREAHPLIETLPERYPWLQLHMHELNTDPANAALYEEMARKAGQQASYVPAFIFCGGMSTGYDAAETTGAALMDALEGCHTYALDNRAVLADQMGVALPPAGSVAAMASTESDTADPNAAAVSVGEADAAAQSENGVAEVTQSDRMGVVAPVAQAATSQEAALLPAEAAAAVAPAIALPFVGSLEAANLSLPALTVTIAALDAFNPCAFFVLMFLLSMMVHARSRKRMFLIGATFVFFSGLIYFLFMAAWLNLFMWIGELTVITLVAGLIAIVIALINIKDYFWFKQGVSLSIPDQAKPGIYQRSRNLLKASSLPAMLAGTAVLAVAANSYELLCTSGFPMVFTRALTLHDLPTPVFYGYLAAYNVIYVIPLLMIVLLFTMSFGARKLKEEEGRVLKLLSGLMMLFLGILLVIRPDALSQAMVAVGLLVAALLLTALIVFIDRRIHPTHPRSPHPA